MPFRKKKKLLNGEKAADQTTRFGSQAVGRKSGR
jgi:hypothetical protein